MRRVALVFVAALLFGLGLLAASCGGGGGKSAGTETVATTEETETGETGETGETETTDTGSATDTIVGTSDAYKTGQAICGNNPIEILAQQYGVKPEVNAIAKAVSLQFTSAKDRADAVAGCLAALKPQG